jgi:hypothetical protein
MNFEKNVKYLCVRGRRRRNYNLCGKLPEDMEKRSPIDRYAGGSQLQYSFYKRRAEERGRSVVISLYLTRYN